MTILLALAFSLLSVAFYLLARLWQENGKLYAARKRTAAVMRRLKQDRDESREDFVSAIETAVEAQRELDALDMKRRKVVPIRGGWAN